jgi:hypothetical protein
MSIASSLSGVSVKITPLNGARENQVNGGALRICCARDFVRELTRCESERSIREVLPTHFFEDAFLP